MATSNIVRGLWEDAKIYLVAVATDGTLSGPDASSFTSVRNGSGDYSITAVTAFAEAPFVTAIAITADRALTQVAPTASVVRIKARTIAASPAASDCSIQLAIFGAPLAASANNNIVHSNSFHNCRLMAVTLAADGSAISGPDAALFTLTDTGTGDALLTAATAFAQIPYAFACPMTADSAVTETITISTIQVKGRSIAASPAAKDTKTNVLIIGGQLSTISQDTVNP